MTYDDYDTTGASAIPDAKLPYGVYDKGHNWKIWSRMAGGGVALTALFLLFGQIAAAFSCLVLVCLVALPLTAKTGLSRVVKLKAVGRPNGNGILSFGWRIQDPIGDFFLTSVWNMLRLAIKKRY